jgi:hypothetical protein
VQEEQLERTTSATSKVTSIQPLHRSYSYVNPTIILDESDDSGVTVGPHRHPVHRYPATSTRTVTYLPVSRGGPLPGPIRTSSPRPRNRRNSVSAGDASSSEEEEKQLRHRRRVIQKSDGKLVVKRATAPRPRSTSRVGDLIRR